MREREEVPGTESNATETGESLEDSQRADLVAYRQALASKVKGGFIELQTAENSVPVCVKPEHIGTVQESFTSDGTYINTEINGHGVFVYVRNRREQVIELIEIAKEQSAAQAAIDGEWKQIAEDLDGVAHQLRHHLANMLLAAHGDMEESALRELTRRNRTLPDFLRDRVTGAIELLQDARRGHVLAKADAERELQKCATQVLQAEERANAVRSDRASGHDPQR